MSNAALAVSHSDDDCRSKATPPATRGRRGHAVIEAIPGLSVWLEQQFSKTPRPTFREIERRLRASEFWPAIEGTGHSTGKSSIHKHYKKWKAKTDHARSTEPMSPDDILAEEATITRVANARILDALQKELSHNGLTADARKLIELHGKLQASSAKREAERRASGRVARDTFALARQEMIELLRAHPDALSIVIEALKNAEEIYDKEGGSIDRRRVRKATKG